MSGGSRFVCGYKTERMIDFTIANKKGIILEEKYIKNLHISDHYGILTTINWGMCNINKVEEHTWFDRIKVTHGAKTRDNIRRHNFSTDDNLLNQELFDRFHKELSNVIEKNTLLWTVKSEDKIIWYKEISKLINKRKIY